MYGNRHTLPSPSATPIIVMIAPNRDAKVSRTSAAAELPRLLSSVMT
jgi:hypothetical protein